MRHPRGKNKKPSKRQCFTVLQLSKQKPRKIDLTYVFLVNARPTRVNTRESDDALTRFYDNGRLSKSPFQ